MIKALFIDLDNTLYAYDPCNNAGKKAVEQLLAAETDSAAADVQSAIAKGRTDVHCTVQDGSSHSRLLYFQKAIEFLQTSVPGCHPVIQDSHGKC